MSKVNINAHCRTQRNVQFIHIYVIRLHFARKKKTKNKQKKNIQRLNAENKKSFDCGPNDFLVFNASNLQ